MHAYDHKRYTVYPTRPWHRTKEVCCFSFLGHSHRVLSKAPCRTIAGRSITAMVCVLAAFIKCGCSSEINNEGRELTNATGSAISDDSSLPQGLVFGRNDGSSQRNNGENHQLSGLAKDQVIELLGKPQARLRSLNESEGRASHGAINYDEAFHYDTAIIAFDKYGLVVACFEKVGVSATPIIIPDCYDSSIIWANKDVDVSISSVSDGQRKWMKAGCELRRSWQLLINNKYIVARSTDGTAFRDDDMLPWVSVGETIFVVWNGSLYLKEGPVNIAWKPNDLFLGVSFGMNSSLLIQDKLLEWAKNCPCPSRK